MWGRKNRRQRSEGSLVSSCLRIKHKELKSWLNDRKLAYHAEGPGFNPSPGKKKGRKLRQKLCTWRPLERQIIQRKKTKTICRWKKQHWEKWVESIGHFRSKQEGWLQWSHISWTVTGNKFLHFVSHFQHLRQWRATWGQLTVTQSGWGTEKSFKLPLRKGSAKEWRRELGRREQA